MLVFVFMHLGICVGISKALLKGDPDALNINSLLGKHTSTVFNFCSPRYSHSFKSWKLDFVPSEPEYHDVPTHRFPGCTDQYKPPRWVDQSHSLVYATTYAKAVCAGDAPQPGCQLVGNSNISALRYTFYYRNYYWFYRALLKLAIVSCENCGEDVDEDVVLALMFQGETGVVAFAFHVLAWCFYFYWEATFHDVSDSLVLYLGIFILRRSTNSAISSPHWSKLPGSKAMTLS
ncbi:uncharacterized protein FMAN_00157 [Fusarium mangiferae]|uniref:Uncharacterized protein n=1 Tax=Fusarium mangiferae TaxID=192010 RepID=A0A1L7TVS4_FUSMA|nr:uncharacterized protein FMAN_00157 [Fusarium mangiferae]CVL02654.1 uncharacterized protein FMAN_00157 [Fusarium mangiferae]